MQKLPEIIKTGLKDLIKLVIIDFPVDMDQAVSESRHLYKDVRKVAIKRSPFGQDLDRIGVILRSSELILGDEVIAEIENSLDRDDKIVFGAGDFVGVSEKVVFGQML
jgi:hypothetical protein